MVVEFYHYPHEHYLSSRDIYHSSMFRVRAQTGFPKWGRLLRGGGGQLGQNGQKLNENYKIDIFGSKHWGGGGHGGDKSIFGVVGVIPSVFPTRGNHDK